MKLEKISINKENLQELGVPLSKNIIIPEYISDKKLGILWNIIEIEDEAFERDPEIESILLPNSIERIGSRAFFECKNLKTINIPKNITEINDSAFEYCLSLKRIRFPKNTKK